MPSTSSNYAVKDLNKRDQNLEVNVMDLHCQITDTRVSIQIEKELEGI